MFPCLCFSPDDSSARRFSGEDAGGCAWSGRSIAGAPVRGVYRQKVSDAWPLLKGLRVWGLTVHEFGHMLILAYSGAALFVPKVTGTRNRVQSMVLLVFCRVQRISIPEALEASSAMPSLAPQPMPVRGPGEGDQANKMHSIKGVVPAGMSIEFGAVKTQPVAGDALKLRSQLSSA